MIRVFFYCFLIFVLFLFIFLFMVVLVVSLGIRLRNFCMRGFRVVLGNCLFFWVKRKVERMLRIVVEEGRVIVLDFSLLMISLMIGWIIEVEVWCIRVVLIWLRVIVC